MNYSEETIKMLIAEFEKELRNHLFSNHNLPVKAVLKIEYPEASQVLEMEFSSGKEVG